MNKKVKISPTEMLYWFALGIYILYWMLKSSNYYYIIGGVEVMKDILRLLVIAIVFCKIIIQRKFNIKTLLGMTLFLMCAIMIYIYAEYTDLIVLVFLIMGADKISSEKIIKFHLYMVIVFTLFITISANIGIIRNDAYLRNISNSNDFVYAQGFMGYATIPLIIMMINFSYTFLKKRLSIKNYIALIIIDIIIYFAFKNRLAFAIEAIFFIFYYFIIKVKNIDKKSIRVFAFFFPFLCMGLMLAATLLYRPGNVFLAKLNDWLSWRLAFGKEGFVRYPISLWGHQVFMRGNLYIGQTSQYAYFYIDVGYIYTLIAYGIVISVFLMIVYGFANYKVVKKNQKLLFCILTTILIANCVNDFLLNCIYNPFILVIFNLLNSEKSRETEEW